MWRISRISRQQGKEAATEMRTYEGESIYFVNFKLCTDFKWS